MALKAFEKTLKRSSPPATNRADSAASSTSHGRQWISRFQSALYQRFFGVQLPT